MLFVCETEPGTLISHDGHVQLGIHHMSLERFLEMQEAEYIVTYWRPDIFQNRYKRVSFQKTAAANAGSPKTDNEGCNTGCDKLKDK